METQLYEIAHSAYYPLNIIAFFFIGHLAPVLSKIPDSNSSREISASAPRGATTRVDDRRRRAIRDLPREEFERSRDLRAVSHCESRVTAGNYISDPRLLKVILLRNKYWSDINFVVHKR